MSSRLEPLHLANSRIWHFDGHWFLGVRLDPVNVNRFFAGVMPLLRFVKVKPRRLQKHSRDR